jgi:hypothetical protein
MKQINNQVKVFVRPRTVKINCEIPAPEKKHPDKGNTYYTIITYERGFGIGRHYWKGEVLDLNSFNRGIWLSQENAQAALDAMLKPIKDYLNGK